MWRFSVLHSLKMCVVFSGNERNPQWQVSLTPCGFTLLQKLQYYEFDPVAIFLGQYRGDLPGDYVVFKACQLTASWLCRPNTCNRFQMKVSLCDIFEKSCPSSTENRVISSPHMAKNHPWSERAAGERNKMKQNKQTQKFIFDFGCEESTRDLQGWAAFKCPGRVQASPALAVSHWDRCDNLFGVLWETGWYFTTSNGASIKKTHLI